MCEGALNTLQHFQSIRQGQFQSEQNHFGTIRNAAMHIGAHAEDEFQSLRPIAHDTNTISQIVSLQGMQC